MRFPIIGPAALAGACCLALLTPLTQSGQGQECTRDQQPMCAPSRTSLPEQPLEQRLENIVTISFQNTPLGKALEEIGQAYGISFVVEEAALSDAGISLDQPVTLKAEQISLKTVMGLLLKDSRLTFAVKDQSVQITTTPKLVTTSYLVADLVTPSEGAKGEARPTQEKKLIDLIMCCVAARSWEVMGGPGTIAYHPLTMCLIVKQTPDVQEQIADLLTELRRLQDMEVSLDVRILTLPDKSYEAIDLDVSNTKSNTPMRLAAAIKNGYQVRVWFSPITGMTCLGHVQAARLLATVRSDPASRIIHAPKLSLGQEQAGEVCFSQTPDSEKNTEMESTEQPVCLRRLTAQPTIELYSPSVSVCLKIDLSGTGLVLPEKPGSPVATTNDKRPKTIFTFEQTVSIPKGSTIVLQGPKQLIKTTRKYMPVLLSPIPYFERLLPKMTCVCEESRQILVMVTPHIIPKLQKKGHVALPPAAHKEKSAERQDAGR